MRHRTKMRPLIILFVPLICVTYCVKCSVGGKPGEHKTYTSPIVTKKHHPIGKDCLGSICSASASRYPEIYIRKLVNKNKRQYNKIFGTVIEPVVKDHHVLHMLRSPFEETDEENVCETKRVTIFPKVAYDVDKTARFIVNIKNHEQGVTFETCITKECFGSDIYFNYKTSCKQIYNMVRLLYVTEKGNLEYGQFQVPSTCVCTYSKKLS